MREDYPTISVTDITTRLNSAGGHGFYTEESNKAYYTDLLTFLATYLKP